MGAHHEAFACFGGWCGVTVEGDGARGSASDAAAWARDQLLAWHAEFTRFDAGSALSRLNADPRTTVPASPLMVELAAAVRLAGETTGGLVDGTLIGALEAAGYATSLTRADGAHGVARAEPVHETADPPRHPVALAASPLAVPAGPSPMRDWATIEVDRIRGTITRPPGVRIDSGGLVKGLLADVLCAWLGDYEDVVVDCCGDVRFGGAEPGTRDIEIDHPFGGTAARLEVGEGAVATSGTTARRWRGPDGHIAHHLIDPATGNPVRSGLVQVTALAPTALEAEVLAKWTLLSGPALAELRLVHGGVVVDESGIVREIVGSARWRAAQIPGR